MQHIKLLRLLPHTQANELMIYGFCDIPSFWIWLAIYLHCILRKAEACAHFTKYFLVKITQQ